MNIQIVTERWLSNFVVVSSVLPELVASYIHLIAVSINIFIIFFLFSLFLVFTQTHTIGRNCIDFGERERGM